MMPFETSPASVLKAAEASRTCFPFLCACLMVGIYRLLLLSLYVVEQAYEVPDSITLTGFCNYLLVGEQKSKFIFL